MSEDEMATSFSALMQTAKEDAGAVTVDVPGDWMQGRSVFGGLQAAIALRSMRSLVPASVLRTLQATFVAPVAEGPVRATAAVLRSGKNATHVEARIVEGAATLAIVIGVFGAPRSSSVSVTPSQPPIEAGKIFDFHYVPGVMPSFVQHFDARWLEGMPPFTGSTSRQHVVEIRMRDEGPATEGHVVAIADFIPPLALTHLVAPAPGSTLTWMLELLDHRALHLPLAGWRVDAELASAGDGYTSQSVMVWGPGGAPVARSHQSMLVFG
jgi:acyl-coenzyme A thioesterase PaaI-like protein